MKKRTLALLLLILGAGLILTLCWRLAKTPEGRFLFGDVETRLQAVREIYRKPAWRAKWFLPRVIRDSQTAVVNEGLLAIVQRGFARLAPDAKKLYDTTDDPSLKAGTLLALGELRAPGINDLAREAMTSSETELRSAGAAVAAMSGDMSLAPLLLTLAKSGRPEERRAALESLIALRSRLCLPLLVEELETESVLSGETALLGLIEITGKNEGMDLDAWRRVIADTAE